jgi:hypothetical protein
MARQTIYKYYVSIRLNDKENIRNNIHINACSKVGALYQAVLLLKKYDVKEVYSLTIRLKAYPIEKRKRQKFLKEMGQKKVIERNNKKAINLIKQRINELSNQ